MILQEWQLIFATSNEPFCSKLRETSDPRRKKAASEKTKKQPLRDVL